nr:ATP-binding protein [uncultured Acetobacterium sp.]
METEFYEQLKENLPCGYAYCKVICDPDDHPTDYQFLDINLTFEQMSGFSRSQLIGKRLYDIVPEQNRNEFDWFDRYGDMAINQNKQPSPEIEQYVSYFQKWYRIRAYSPKKYHFIAVFIDITQEVENQKALEYSMSYQNAILEAIPDLLFILDHHGFFIDYKNGPESDLYLSPDLFVGKNVIDIFPESLAKNIQTALEHIYMDQSVSSFEYELTMQNVQNYYECRMVPFASNRIIAIVRNISERRKMERNLHIHESILTAVAAAIEEFLDNRDVIAATIKGFELIGQAAKVDRVYLWENDYDEHDHGRTSQRIEWTAENAPPQINNPELQQIPFEDIQDFIDPLVQGQPFYGIVGELKNTRTKEILWSQGILSIIVVPIIVNGLFWGFIGFDECKEERQWTEAEFSTLFAYVNSLGKAIERRQIEEELELAKNQAELANNMKSRFLANMSHEIRTPINGIMGYLELLQYTQLSTEQKEYVQESKYATEILLYLLNDILDFSKIESGQLSIESIEFDLLKTVEDSLSMFLPKVLEKKLSLKTNFDPTIPKYVLGDPARVGQILSNLISNAIKFTDSGEIIMTVHLGSYKHKKAEIIFEISDTGIGISEEQQQKLFKPFVQGDPSTTRKYGGSGLGLAIAKELIHLMDGTIHICSTFGTGTTFNFNLFFGSKLVIENDKVEFEKLKPVNPEALVSENTTQSVETNLDLSNLNILLVEDNLTNQKIVSKILKLHNNDCDLAGNGQEALEAVQNKDYDLILMDCQMPMMDGYESTIAIRSLKGPKKDIPIIAMTANAMEGDQEKCLAAGMNDYLSKPIDYDKMLRLLAIYGKKQHASPPIISPLIQNMERFMTETGLSQSDALEIFGDFFEYTPAILAVLIACLNSIDFIQLQKAAHQLKGSSSNLRIDTINLYTIQLEKAAAEKNSLACQKILNDILIEFKEIKENWENAFLKHHDNSNI